MKILLIDDHALFREGMVLLLQKLGMDLETVEAESCETAFHILNEDQGIDLAVMDLNLPGMSGMDGIAVMRERYPAIPVVALSSSDEMDIVLNAIDRGAMGFIPKSSSSSAMIGALHLILAKGVYLPPSVILGNRPYSKQDLKQERRLPSAPAMQEESAKAPITPSQLGLTERQAEVLYLILQGKPAKIICRELTLSASTVKVHTRAVLRALNVTTRTEAVIAAWDLGLRFKPSLANK